MKKAIVVAAVICVLFAIRTFGQTRVPVVITSDYYAQSKVLVLHALNNSGKDITGYTIIIRHKKADGTLDENGRSEHLEDMLAVLITTEMAKGSRASESIRLQNSANAIFPKDHGIFVFSRPSRLGEESWAFLSALKVCNRRSVGRPLR